MVKQKLVISTRLMFSNTWLAQLALIKLEHANEVHAAFSTLSVKLNESK